MFKYPAPGGRRDMNTILSKKAIKIGYKAESWTDAVSEAGRLLVEAGVVEEQYIDAMIKMVEKYGTYFIVAAGVAMPHSHSSNGVLKNGVSYLRLAEPIYFPDKPDKPIELLIAVAAMGNSGHLDMMGNVAEAISSPDSLAHLMGLTDPEDIVDIINSTEVVT